MAASVPPSSPPPLLSLRAVVLLLAAALIGLGVGVLTFYGNGSRNVALAVLAGVTATGASVAALHSLVGDT